MSTAQQKPVLVESAARIAAAIAASGMSYARVAERVGLQDPTGASVYNWARGKHAPTEMYRQKLAEVLGLDVEDVVPKGWSTAGGGRKPNARGRPRLLTDDEKLQAKRERDREYRRRKDAEGRGPAERAVMLYADAPGLAAPAVPRAAPRPEVASRQAPQDVFTTAIRADGTMQVRLNLTLPIPAGIALVQMLYAADALKLAVTQETEKNEAHPP